MAVDFALNDNGDIAFIQSSRKSEAFQLDFLIADSNSLRLDFFVNNTKEQSYLDGMIPGLIFNFYLDNIEYDKDILLLESKEDIVFQQIKIRLNTALSTIKNNEALGSEIDNLKHRILNGNDKDKYEDVIDCIRNAIKDVLPNAEITVKKINTIYTDYSNSLIVTIVKDEINYYYYL